MSKVRTKKTNNGKKGGNLVGKPHDTKSGKPAGGIKAVVTDNNNQPVELEGGEVIINKEASKKHWRELSRINQSAGDGVPIGPPIDPHEADPDEYKKGGKIEFNPNKIPNKWILKYAENIKKNHPDVWDLGGNIFGNQAFINLKRVAERGYWLDSEEWMMIKWRSYVARHKKDFRIAGVIAMLKWVDKVDRGWPYMKDLIEAEIRKRANRKKLGGKMSKKDKQFEDAKREDRLKDHPDRDKIVAIRQMMKDANKKKKGGYVSYKDKYNKKYGFKKGESHSLSDIAKTTGISKKGIQEIYNKGIGAYKTNPSSVRPSVKSKEQWAYARVYSAVMGGKASDVDEKELKMQKGGFLEEMVDYVRENNVPIESKGVVIEDLGMNESMTDYVDLDYYQDAILEARKKALKKSTKDRSFTSYGPKGNKMQTGGNVTDAGDSYKVGDEGRWNGNKVLNIQITKITGSSVFFADLTNDKDVRKKKVDFNKLFVPDGQMLPTARRRAKSKPAPQPTPKPKVDKGPGKSWDSKYKYYENKLKDVVLISEATSGNFWTKGDQYTMRITRHTTKSFGVYFKKVQGGAELGYRYNNSEFESMAKRLLDEGVWLIRLRSGNVKLQISRKTAVPTTDTKTDSTTSREDKMRQMIAELSIALKDKVVNFNTLKSQKFPATDGLINPANDIVIKSVEFARYKGKPRCDMMIEAYQKQSNAVKVRVGTRLSYLYTERFLEAIRVGKDEIDLMFLSIDEEDNDKITLKITYDYDEYEKYRKAIQEEIGKLRPFYIADIFDNSEFERRVTPDYKKLYTIRCIKQKDGLKFKIDGADGTFVGYLSVTATALMEQILSDFKQGNTIVIDGVGFVPKDAKKDVQPKVDNKPIPKRKKPKFDKNFDYEKAYKKFMGKHTEMTRKELGEMFVLEFTKTFDIKTDKRKTKVKK